MSGSVPKADLRREFAKLTAKLENKVGAPKSTTNHNQAHVLPSQPPPLHS